MQYEFGFFFLKKKKQCGAENNKLAAGTQHVPPGQLPELVGAVDRRELAELQIAEEKP